MTDSSCEEVALLTEADIVTVRQTVREAAARLGFGVTDIARITTAASELARNVFLYAGSGLVRCRQVNRYDHVGLELVVEDHGPGIADLDRAMTPGHTSGNGLGLGLPGAKRLMDEMEVETEVGKGTKITLKKWRKGT